MFSKALKKLTCVFSALLLAALSLGSDLTEFRAAVESARSVEELNSALHNAPESLASDPNLTHYLGRSVDQLVVGSGWRSLKGKILETIDGRLAFEQPPASGKVGDAAGAAKKILNNPLYVDRQGREGRNWLDNAASRIGERLYKWLENLIPQSGPTIGNIGGPNLGGLTYVAWFLLGAVILLIVYFVVKNFKGVGRRRRQVGGILEDDEPERTADQWLAQAEKLESEGKYREAVRCFYIACLVRYDDGRVARFRRHETNWEHLYRIESSPQNPSSIDFRSSTQKFDKVWYGFMVKGHEDVAEFREVYKRLCEALQIKIAA